MKRKRDVSPSVVQPTKKKQQWNPVMALASLLFMLLPIRLDNYGLAYRKFQKIPKNKGNQRLIWTSIRSCTLGETFYRRGIVQNRYNNTKGWLRKQLIHDCFPVSDSAEALRVAARIYNADNRRYRKIRFQNTVMLLIGYHATETSLPDHLHVVLNCRWAGSACRCQSIASIPRSPGFRRTN